MGIMGKDRQVKLIRFSDYAALLLAVEHLKPDDELLKAVMIAIGRQIFGGEEFTDYMSYLAEMAERIIDIQRGPEET